MREALGQMARIEERLAAGNAALSRDLALYLQVLREGLPQATAQAVFHLATQVMPERYGTLPDAQRGELQVRLQQLVRRCTSLLTLEQLVVLGRQVRAEGQRLERREQQRLMAAIAAAADHPTTGHEPEESMPAGQPRGSIRLGLDLPLSADLFGGDVPGLAGLGALLAPIPASGSESKADGTDDDAAGEEAASGEENEGPSAEESPQRLPQQAPQHRPGPSQETASELPPVMLAPRRPQELLRWWGNLDRALERRLRNLSHAINLDLLRLGLSRGLLPVTLLEAVLRGQLEPLPAPANLVRLAMPLGPEHLGGRIEAHGLLLRAADLEFEQPRLRSCRRRLERRRQEVRRMAQQYRHWQRRARSLEAERQWLQDNRHPIRESTPPPTA